MAVNLKGVGTVWEFIQRLAGMPGSSVEAVGEWMQRIVDDPFQRRQASMLMKGDIVVRDLSRDDWIDREMARLNRFAELPSLAVSPDLDAVARACSDGCGWHDHYVLLGRGMPALLAACKEAGIKVGNMVIPSGGENLPLERGVIRCDLRKIMQPTAPIGKFVAPPFMMTKEEQIEWANGRGGKGITSVEEALYLILTAYVCMGHMPFMGGWIRCRNTCGSGRSLSVTWSADDGLRVGSVDLARAFWRYGAVPRQFQSVDVGT